MCMEITPHFEKVSPLVYMTFDNNENARQEGYKHDAHSDNGSY